IAAKSAVIFTQNNPVAIFLFFPCSSFIGLIGGIILFIKLFLQFLSSSSVLNSLSDKAAKALPITISPPKNADCVADNLIALSFTSVLFLDEHIIPISVTAVIKKNGSLFIKIPSL